MKFVLVLFFAGLLRVPSLKGEQHRWRAGHSYPGPLPQEIMVDAVNYIGLVLLHAHNQNNENNIAFSPYGATSVLVALGEGVQGTALDEILRSTLLPLDVSVTRVGLRDIHRHLKSYFIPQEGFLAGLTFSHENVTLKSSYEDILRFYGYDVDSFNNPLYPDPYSSTTNIGEESTTESLEVSATPAETINTSTAQTLETTSTSLPGTTFVHTAESTLTTLPVPSTIQNRDEFNVSETTTVQTTPTTTDQVAMQTTRVTNTVSSTAQTTQVATETLPATTTVVTTPPATIGAATAVPSTTTMQTTRVTNTTSSTTQTTQAATKTIPSTTTVVTTPPTTTVVATTIPTTTTMQTTRVTNTTSSTTQTTQIATETIPPTTTIVTTPPATVAVTTAIPATTITVAPETTTTPIKSTASSTTTIVTTTTPSSIQTFSTVQTTTTTSTTLPTTSTNPNSESTTPTPLTTITTQSARPTAVTISVVPSMLGNGNTDSTTASNTMPTVSTTQVGNTGPIVINLQPTTLSSNTANTAPESTTAARTSDSSDTPSTTIISTTSNTESTLNSNSETPTIFTVDISPSTIGTGSTPTTDTTTANPVPTLITTAGGLQDGYGIDVRPSTIAPQNAAIVSTEGDKNINMATIKPRKKKGLPRFRDDIDLIKSLNFENNSEGVHKIAERSFMSESSTSRNSFNDNKKIGANLFENMKDIFIDASIVTSSDISTTMPNSDFAAKTNDDLTGETTNTTNSMLDSTESDVEYMDEDVIIVNKEADLSDEVAAEIVLSDEEVLPESNLDKRSISTEDFKPRGTRSVVDYLIARYHDNNPTNIHMATNGEYEPNKPTTFAVNGKIRESNISFMSYDTVLPFRYISYLNALALTFPLDSTKYYLLLILPLDEMGIDTLVSNMMSTTLKQIIYHLQPTRVKATIPSFMLKGYVVLTPTLQKLGIRQIFEPRHADFSRMTEDKDIYVTNIEQAVTVTIRNYVDPSTLQNNQHFRRRGPVHFTADHPFLYFVMDSEIHVALMAGKIINPLNSRIR